jgi:hypothetical protein
MKKRNVSARKVACQGFALGAFVFTQLVEARDALAESPRKVEGFELLGSLGYAITVRDWSFNDKKIDPFGVLVGLDFGYTFPFGLRLGSDAVYGFGRTIESTDWRGEVSTTDSSSFAWSASVGYDLMLSSSFRLRGAADAGLLVLFYESEDEAGVGMNLGPKLALIWQSRAFELGLQSRWGPAAHGRSRIQPATATTTRNHQRGSDTFAEQLRGDIFTWLLTEPSIVLDGILSERCSRVRMRLQRGFAGSA